jgi:hypothetical protein
MLPSAVRLHLKFDAQILSVKVDGVPGDEESAFGLPGHRRTLLPDLLFTQLQPDAPENRSHGDWLKRHYWKTSTSSISAEAVAV